MSILGILFSGEERAMVHRVAMAIWEREHPWDKVSWRLMLSFLVKIPDGITTPQGTEKIGDLRESMMRGQSGGGD
jgi:hypothetical protein